MRTLYKLLNNNSNTILDLTNFNSVNAEICLDNNYIDYAYINGEHHILSEIRDNSGNVGIFFKDININQTENSNIVTNFLNISSITLDSTASNSGAITIHDLGSPYDTLKYNKNNTNDKMIVLSANTTDNVKTSINSYELKADTNLHTLIPTLNGSGADILKDYELPEDGADTSIKITSDYTKIEIDNSKLKLSQGANNSYNILENDGNKLLSCSSSSIYFLKNNQGYILKSESEDGTELNESSSAGPYFRFDIGEREFVEDSSADAITIKFESGVYKIICNELIEEAALS